MSPQATMVSLILMSLFAAIFRLYGGERYSCPHCGTKTGEHDTSCVWHSED